MQMRIEHTLQSELTTRYKEYFESKLALTIFQHPDSLPAMAKISKRIAEIMEKNKEILVNEILNDTRIVRELTDQRFFGRIFNKELGEKATDSNAEKIFNRMIDLLKNANSSLDQIMQMHSVYIYRIHNQLDTESKIIFAKEVMDRARIIKKGEIKSSDAVGIARHPVYKKLLKQKTYEHERAIDRYVPDNHSYFFNQTVLKSLPFVAGPSGHTKTLMTGALALGLKEEEELKQYALACFAFLGIGGNHSFHEVMTRAQESGFQYKENNYTHHLSFSFKNRDFYQQLQKEFADLLEPFIEKDNFKKLSK